MKDQIAQLSASLTDYCSLNDLVWMVRCQPTCPLERIYNLNIWDMGGERLRADIYGNTLLEVLKQADKRVICLRRNDED